MYNYFYDGNINCQVCLTHGMYSLDPTARSIRETLIYEVRQLCYYLIKTKDMGYENLAIIDRMMDIVSAINFSLDYKKEIIEELLNELHKARVDVIEFYINICNENAVDCQLITPFQAETPIKIDLISAIKMGEKHALMKNTQMPKYKKDLLETITLLGKNAATAIVKLNDYNIDCSKEKYETIELINYLNFAHYDEEKLIKKVERFASMNYSLNDQLFHHQRKIYGEPEINKVKLDYVKGKCILVSGNDLYDLEQLLLATADKDINVYTHDRAILAFAYPYFQKFPHFKGHFQTDLNCFQTDFANFPGPILLTKDYSERVNNISRGMVYSMECVVGKGFAQIHKYDFTPIIEYAQNAPGFSSNVKKLSTKVGYDFEKIKEKIKEIAESVKNMEYNKIFIVGVVNYCMFKEAFLDELFNKIGENNFIISLIYKKKAKNVYSPDAMFDFSLVYQVVEEFKKYELGEKLPITIFITQCNRYTPSNILSLHHLGIKDIYLCCCIAHGLNPSIMDCLANDFHVKKVPLNLDFQVST